MANSISRSQAKKDLQTRQRAWLDEIVQMTGEKPSTIAENAGVSDTTLTRLLYNKDYSGTLTQVTIDRIKARYKVPGPEETTKSRGATLLSFSEAERLEDKREEPALLRVIAAITERHVNVEPWRLKTTSLELAGFLAGDIVFVDTAATPQAQDAVCAQIADYGRGSAETIWRIFDPPYLVGAAHDRTAYKPILIDHDRVKVRGVIVDSLRPHRLSTVR